MKLALFADVHSNLEPLNACLEEAKALGAQRYAFLGDLVGYGADPNAVLDIVAKHVSEGAIAVLGNHDAAVLGETVRMMNPSAQAAVEWTRREIGAPQREFLGR